MLLECGNRLLAKKHSSEQLAMIEAYFAAEQLTQEGWGLEYVKRSEWVASGASIGLRCAVMRVLASRSEHFNVEDHNVISAAQSSQHAANASPSKSPNQELTVDIEEERRPPGSAMEPTVDVHCGLMERLPRLSLIHI